MLHEYSALDGVQEDVVDVLLNLKGVVLKLHNRDHVTLKLAKTGEGPVTAADIEPNHDVEIINPDHVIAHLTAGGKIEMEIKVEKGRGYQPATVRIVGDACGAIQEGSGFAVAPNYIITNAHVVAGERATEVQEQNVGSLPSTVVVFDPKLDIAILHVETPIAHVLSLEGTDVSRGEGGVVLGYPGGGPFIYRRAAVRRDLDAVGRDIYGRSDVERDVYELQAIVRPGNSGGPFVLLDGTVAGVVFAASTTDADVGYALTTPQIMPLVQKAETRTAAVSTQGCVP